MADVTVLCDERFGKADDWLHVKQSQIGVAELEHTVTQRRFLTVTVKSVRVFTQTVFQVFPQCPAPIGWQDIFRKRKPCRLKVSTHS
ncbi:MAG TPA: hypothetical protein DIT99_28615 [Candidatus Latescibacteria bacterium]|nr:hypothetical protein [Candidatus Latescibacterota bacterium]